MKASKFFENSPMFDSVEVIKSEEPPANCPHGYINVASCKRCTPVKVVLRDEFDRLLTCKCCRVLYWEPLADMIDGVTYRAVCCDQVRFERRHA